LFLLQNNYIKSVPKKHYSPYTYQEKLEYYRKINRNASASYYYFANKHKKMYKLHIVFTKKEEIDKYQKMDDVLLIREDFFKKLQNLNLLEVYYFSNIELGENYDNPHLDTQLWIEEKDVVKIERVYNKIIDNHNLVDYLCEFNKQDKYISDIEVFTYTVKEYAKDLTDDEVYKLGQARKDYRKKLGKKNLRFYTNSRKPYSKSIYKKLYFMFGFDREKSEYILDNEIVLVYKNTELIFNIDIYLIWIIRQLIYIVNKLIKIQQNELRNCFFDIKKVTKVFWCFWLFGFL